MFPSSSRIFKLAVFGKNAYVLPCVFLPSIQSHLDDASLLTRKDNTYPVSASDPPNPSLIPKILFFVQQRNWLTEKRSVSTGLRIRRSGTLVLPLPLAEPKLDGLLRDATRDPVVRRNALDVARAASAHAPGDGGRARDVGRARAGVRCGARGRRDARVSECAGARRARCAGRVPEPAVAWAGGTPGYRGV